MNCVIWGTGSTARLLSISEISNNLGLNVKCYCDGDSK